MANLSLNDKEDRKFRDTPSGMAVAVIEPETPPTDSSKTNGSLVITYNASNQPTTIEKTISGTVYTKTLTWTGDVCTAVSAWS